VHAILPELTANPTIVDLRIERGRSTAERTATETILTAVENLIANPAGTLVENTTEHTIATKGIMIGATIEITTTETMKWTGIGTDTEITTKRNGAVAVKEV
jgi:hypothetical protein